MLVNLQDALRAAAPSPAARIELMFHFTVAPWLRLQSHKMINPGPVSCGIKHNTRWARFSARIAVVKLIE